MKTFKDHLNEGMPKGAIAGFDGPDGEIEIYKKGSGFYGDTGDFDFSAKNVKELKKILKDIGANPNKPSFGELPEDRDYRKEYDNYHAQPEQRERNAARLRARRQMVKAGKVEKFDKKDVHHKDNNPLNNKEDNLAVTTQNWNRTEPRLRKEEVKVNEKTEYYLDTSKDNTEKYVANDGDYWYTGKVGVKGENMFLKFVATHGKNSYFERGKLKKTTPEKLEKDVGMRVDFKKLYKK